MDYKNKKLSHTFACWTAGLAGSSVPQKRVKVMTSRKWLEHSGLKPDLTIDHLTSEEQIDQEHRLWRDKMISASDGFLSHGHAAKFINVYLKTRFVVGQPPSQARDLLHPPIDRLLLTKLRKLNFGGENAAWLKYKHVAWSKLTSDEYESLIAAFRKDLSGAPLWSIETHWPGYQSEGKSISVSS